MIVGFLCFFRTSNNDFNAETSHVFGFSTPGDELEHRRKLHRSKIQAVSMFVDFVKLPVRAS